MEALTQERDDLAARLNIIEGEAVAELMKAFLDGQRQNECIET
jgi:hypothetical protein